jgi:hypothetical protein
MVNSSDWPESFRPGSVPWFEALKKKLQEIEGGDGLRADDLLEKVETNEEAMLLFEIIRRTAK